MYQFVKIFVCWHIIFIILYIYTGFLLYFAYGMHHSNEGRPVTYGPMVTYGGEADMSAGTLSRMDEEVVQQQPETKDEIKSYGT